MQKHCYQLILAMVFLSLAGVFAQSTSVLSAKQVPQSTTTPKDFAPKGWQIEQSLNADFNGDGVADIAAVLVETFVGKANPDNLPERQRALLVALKKGNRYQRVGLGPRALICTRCGGAFWGIGEVSVNLAVLKNVLLVSFESGANEINGQTYRYRLSTTSSGQRMQLIGMNSKSYWRTTGDFTDKSSNYLTGERVVTTGNESRDNKTPATTKKSRFSNTPIYLEDVNIENHY
jgi:hypothetical protein